MLGNDVELDAVFARRLDGRQHDVQRHVIAGGTSRGSKVRDHFGSMQVSGSVRWRLAASWVVPRRSGVPDSQRVSPVLVSRARELDGVAGGQPFAMGGRLDAGLRVVGVAGRGLVLPL